MRLPISTMMLIFMAGMCLFLFVGFNYAFNSEGGLKNKLWDVANKTLDGKQETQFDNLMPQLTQGFGIAGVLFILLAFLSFIIDAFSNPPREV